MKLYLLSQDNNIGYDTYDACVVCAKSVKDALTIHPGGGDDLGTWTEPENVKCEYLGLASADAKRGVVLASFNAG